MTDQLSSDLASLRIDRHASPPERGGWRWALLVLVGLAAVAGGVYVALPRLSGVLAQKAEVETSEVALVVPSAGGVDLTATGYIVPQTLVRVAPRGTGRIEQVLVKEGDRVQKGQTLFVLDAATRKTSIQSANARAAAARARAATARANLAEVQQQVERQRRLAASGAVASATVDDLVARANVLRAQVDSADAEAAAVSSERAGLQVELDETGVLSPIAGRVISRPMAAGESASPDKTLVEIADFDSLVVEVDVAEGKLERIKTGMPAEIILDAYPSKRLAGSVVDVNPRINRAKATGTVKVKVLDGKDIALPDMAARVNFLTQPLKPGEAAEPPKNVLPASALAERNGGKVVFVLQDGKAHMVPVVLGSMVGGGYEIKEGPPPGTRVIRSPPPTLVDGQVVKEKAP